VGTAFPEARVLGLPEKPNGELARHAAASLRKELSRRRALLVGPGMGDETAVVAMLRSALHGEGD
jgi:ADP-dependent NAD(P)H-hydrate dehydratase